MHFLLDVNEKDNTCKYCRVNSYFESMSKHNMEGINWNVCGEGIYKAFTRRNITMKTKKMKKDILGCQ